MIRVGVVGAGFAANLYAEGLVGTGRAEVVGVVSATESSRRAFAERWNCPGLHRCCIGVRGNGD